MQILQTNIWGKNSVKKRKDEKQGFTVWEVSWRLNRTATYRPPLFWLSQLFFPVLLGCSTGGLGAQPLLRHGSYSSIFSPTDLNFLSPGLYNNLTSIYFLRASQFRTQFNPSTVKVTPDLLISSTGCTCYLHQCISSFDSLAGSEANMQHYLKIINQHVCLAKRKKHGQNYQS